MTGGAQKYLEIMTEEVIPFGQSLSTTPAPISRY